LKGQKILKQNSGTLSELDSAENLFKSALAIDPDFILAHIGLADAYLENLFWHRARDVDILPKAKEAVLKAMEIDPEIGECYGILGSIEFYSLNFRTAEFYLKKAIALAPGYIPAHERLAWLYLYKDSIKTSLNLIEKIITLDPLSSRYYGTISYVYCLDHRYDEGIRVLRSYLEKYGNDNFILWHLASLLMVKGDFQEALKIFNQRTIGNTNWLMGYTYAKTGNLKKAREILEINLRKAGESYVPSYVIAVQYLGLNEVETALDYLEKDLFNSDQLTFIMFLKKDPLWIPVHNHPRFKAILQKITQRL
jgi:tetratricopeptide (TPR) repeat protein